MKNLLLRLSNFLYGGKYWRTLWLPPFLYEPHYASLFKDMDYTLRRSYETVWGYPKVIAARYFKLAQEVK